MNVQVWDKTTEKVSTSLAPALKTIESVKEVGGNTVST